MTTSTMPSENANAEADYKTKESCLIDMWKKYAKQSSPHCRPDWDDYAEMCWGPTPASQVAKLPCPDDGYMNPNQLATRSCLPNATWYINHTFDDKPYTNFDNCLIPVDLSAEDDLKKLVDSKIIFMLKSMDEYKNTFIILHVVSIFLLVIAAIISGAVAFKLKHRTLYAFPYLSLAVAATSLILSNIVILSVSGVDDATNVIKCRAAKSVVIFTSVLFYECLFGYLFMCIVPILQITIRPLFMKVSIASVLTVTVILVFAEMIAETISSPTKYCGFRTLQSSFHWLTTTPNVLLIMVHICLNSVTIYGTIYLKHPHLKKGGQLHHLRQKAISASVLVLYNVAMEILHVLIHTEAYMQYTDQPVHEYILVYSFVVAAHGSVFSVLLCFIDLYVLNMLRFPVKCAQYQLAGNEDEHKTVQMFSMSGGCYRADGNPGNDLDYDAVPQDEVPSPDIGEQNVEHHSNSAMDRSESRKQTYVSELHFGSLKQTNI